MESARVQTSHQHSPFFCFAFRQRNKANYSALSKYSTYTISISTTPDGILKRIADSCYHCPAGAIYGFLMDCFSDNIRNDVTGSRILENIHTEMGARWVDSVLIVSLSVENEGKCVAHLAGGGVGLGGRWSQGSAPLQKLRYCLYDELSQLVTNRLLQTQLIRQLRSTILAPLRSSTLLCIFRFFLITFVCTFFRLPIFSFIRWCAGLSSDSLQVQTKNGPPMYHTIPNTFLKWPILWGTFYTRLKAPLLDIWIWKKLKNNRMISKQHLQETTRQRLRAVHFEIERSRFHSTLKRDISRYPGK
jgi:hypothetical protein